MGLVKLVAALAMTLAVSGCIGDYLNGAPLGSPAACKGVPAGTTIVVETAEFSSTVVCKG